MSELTMQDLREIMREAAGDDEVVDPARDIADVPFVDLGFDSLALLETVTLVKRRCGVAVEDDELDQVGTPNLLLAKVNSALGAAA